MRASQIPEERLYVVPFQTKEYGRSAGAALRSTRVLTAVALLCAMCAVIDVFFIPVGGTFLRISFSFLIAAVLCQIGGPAYALPAGFLVDLLSFLIGGGDPAGYFPGYALSSMLAFLIYALFLFRARLSLLRLFLCKLTVNFGINVILGSVWKHMLYGKAYSFYFVSGAVKNLGMLPVETALMAMVFTALLPILRKTELIPRETELRSHKWEIPVCILAAVIGVIGLILYYRWTHP